MKALKRKLIPAVDLCLHVYWFMFRPKTYGAVALILNKQNETLLIQQSYGSGSWKLCGGAVDRGEKPEMTIVREIREELGLTVHHPEFFYQLFSTRQYKKDHVHVYIVRTGNVETQIDGVEVIASQWFSLDALPRRLSSIATEVLQKFQTEKP